MARETAAQRPSGPGWKRWDDPTGRDFCLPPTPWLSLLLRPGWCPFQGLQAPEVAEEEGQPPPGGWGEGESKPGRPHTATTRCARG